MRKIILLFFILLISFSKKANAQENFTVTANIEYQIDLNGTTKVTNTITIINNIPEFYSRSFIFRISGLNPKNIKVYEQGRTLNFFRETKNNVVDLTIDFEKPVVGKGASRTFIVTYEDETIAEKLGEVREIRIPKLENYEEFKNYKVTISVPQEFGAEAFVNPSPRKIEYSNKKINYKFEKEDVVNQGILIVFGNYQVYKLKLTYHLENNSSDKKDIEIALPPDTFLQKVYYQKIEPLPEDIKVDEDGNWLAIYSLNPKQTLTVNAEAVAQVFSKPVNENLTPNMNLINNTKPTQTWQSNDPEIKNLASSLKTPESIYRYLVNNFKYNYERLNSDPSRLGAKDALKNPNSFLCTEFTDLFIALARANGIPAREINGFAYSDNPILKPLSLVADVLHAWPEYWDEKTKTWVAVDPTWGATSGLDYFNNFDLNHITFVIHGLNPYEPKPAGTYKTLNDAQKDVFVELGELPKERLSSLEIKILPTSFLPLSTKKFKIIITNTGPSALYKVNPEIIIGDQKLSFNLALLPPFAKFQKEISIPTGLMAKKIPNSILVKADREQVEVSTEKGKIIILQSVLMFLMLLLFFLSFYVKIVKPNIFSILLTNFKEKLISLNGEIRTKIFQQK